MEKDTNPKPRHWKPNAKVTVEQVLMIRKLREEGIRQKDIASRFNISNQQVSDIVNKRAWKNVS